jgi:hypothetical protein
VDSNPVYRNGLALLVARAKLDMDQGLVPGPDADNGGNAYVDYPAEQYAELFAFMSLVDPDQASRDNYAQRARTLLMYIIDKAALGAAEHQPYRDPEFSIYDRSRWHGEGFALTVDWIYPYLSATDKTSIRQVFLRWIDENQNAVITGHDHPVPIGTANDPLLVSDPTQVRWSLNNYWTAHMRNIGLMALSLDAADDPSGTLRGYLGTATGAWLYVLDYALRHDAQGGLVPEGLEYGPQTLGFATQFLLALHTAGADDTAMYGTQVSISSQPFWSDSITSYLHSASPRTTSSADLNGASVFLPAWYGDGQHYYLPDFIELFGPLGLYYASSGNTAGLNSLRWIQSNAAPGGAALLTSRANDRGAFQKSILYFLLFDPAAATATDPRAVLPLTSFSPGLGRILSRTDWSEDASWFTYKLRYNKVDHQYGDGNQFEFYRKGEWLTKERTGYDLDYGAAQNHNTLALENDVPGHNNACDYRNINYLNGSQWSYVASGNPDLVARSVGSDYVYALGDATNLYNSDYEGATDILHASRSVLWLEPDFIVVYDRATSKTANRFKRFWLNTATLGSVNGTRTSVTTTAGQKLYISTLLPTNAQITSEASTLATCPNDTNGWVASDEPMGFRIKVEAPGGPADTRFLNVLQGADAGVSAAPTQLIQSSSGKSFAGAVTGSYAVLFPVDLTTPFSTITYTVPITATKHFVTGLQPGQGYTVTQMDVGGNLTTNISLGGDVVADSGGVLTTNIASIQTWVITVTVTGSNGTVSCTSPVNSGTPSTCTVTPAIGYQLETFTDNNIDKKSSVVGTAYTISNVTSGHTIAATFSLIKVAQVNGTCGTSHGGTFSIAPTTNLCTAGTVSTNVTGSSPWNWLCVGTNSGTTAICSANAQQIGKLGDFNNDGVVSISEVQQVINSFLGL